MKTLGYPTIEKLLENENFDELTQSMKESYDLLERMLQEKSKGMKKQRDILKALKAFDLSSDLLRYLLKTKAEMLKEEKKSK